MIIIFIHFPRVGVIFLVVVDNHGLLANVLNRFRVWISSDPDPAQVSWLCFAYVFSFAGAIFYAVQQTKLFVRANLQEVPLKGGTGIGTGRLVDWS